MKRILPLLLGALCGWGCDDSASPPLPAVAPPPPAPAPSPPPDPPEPEPDGDIVVGFSQDRIDIREGESIPVEVRFDAGTDLRSTWFHHLTIPLRVTVEDGSASADDVVVARRVGVYGLGFGRTAPVSDVSLVPLRAREDGVSEGGVSSDR